MQDIIPEDVDRIEVISGPGATLWGANAVNGVINIVTRNAGASQGGYVSALGGSKLFDAAVRFGDRINDTINYRLYVKGRRRPDSVEAADDDAYRVQAGARFDWSPSDADLVTFQGDIQRGSRGQGALPDEVFRGGNIVARWNRSWSSASALQLQFYYDHAGRETLQDNGRFQLDTFDVDFQHSFQLAANHNVVWGGGARVTRYNIDDAPGLAFSPDKRTLFLANIFVQDSMALTPSLTAIAGLKLERDPYSGAVLLPSARLSWKPSSTSMLWAAASRAIRSPTPFDRDVVESVGDTVFLIGPADFRSEKLTALEAGVRLVLTSQASLSVSSFYNLYDDLRNIELAPSGFLPLQWGNGIKGSS